MIARAGTCVTISACIVIAATVILHQAERKQARSAPAVPVAKRPEEPLGAAPKAPPAAPRLSETERTPHPEPTRTPARPSTRKPESASTRVRPGETFTDVGKRVYGEGVDLQALWKINRDQLVSPTSDVRPGMILRTPEF